MSRSPEEEMERGQRPWLPSNRGTGRGCGILPTDLWPLESEVRLGKVKVNLGVDPTGYGRPRGDAWAYLREDLMTLWLTVPGSGSVGAAPWARPEEVRCLDSEGQRVIIPTYMITIP